MDTIIVISAVLIIWSCLQFLELRRVRRVARKYQHLYRVEVTESHFANARNELMQLALQKKIDVNSFTFKYLYSFNTALMRRPDQFQKLSESMFKSIWRNSETNSNENIFKKEQEQWTPEVKRVFHLTADAIGYIVVEYSGFLRFVLKWLRRKDKSLNHTHAVDFLLYISKQDRRAIEAEREMKEVQDELYKFSGASANSFQLC